MFERSRTLFAVMNRACSSLALLVRCEIVVILKDVGFGRELTKSCWCYGKLGCCTHKFGAGQKGFIFVGIQQCDVEDPWYWCGRVFRLDLLSAGDERHGKRITPWLPQAKQGTRQQITAYSALVGSWECQ